MGKGRGMTATITSARETNRANVIPFASSPVIEDPQNKPYNRMTPVQQRWADTIRRRTEDPNWRLLGTPWNVLKWELQYLMGYTWVPSRENAGIHGGIETLKSVGLCTITHFWMHDPKRQQAGLEPEIGIAVRLYKVTFDEASGAVVFGHDGGMDDNNSSCLAKNLHYMPYAGAHGAVIDPEKVPMLLDAALALENEISICGTQEGRKYLSSPTFPSCLFGFTEETVPSVDSINLEELQRATLQILQTAIDDDGCAINGDWISWLQMPSSGRIAAIDTTVNDVVIELDGGGKIIFPRCCALRECVVLGAQLDAGTPLADVLIDETSRTWADIVDELGDYGSSWLLNASYDASCVSHSYAGTPLVCVPHVLVSDLANRTHQKFLDMRPFLGRQYRSLDDPEEILNTAAGEMQLRVIHLRQPACAESLQFVGTGFRADLWTVKNFWAKHFKSGKPPMLRKQQAR